MHGMHLLSADMKCLRCRPFGMHLLEIFLSWECDVMMYLDVHLCDTNDEETKFGWN